LVRKIAGHPARGETVSILKTAIPVARNSERISPLADPSGLFASKGKFFVAGSANKKRYILW
jgi:hypothetical protein